MIKIIVSKIFLIRLVSSFFLALLLAITFSSQSKVQSQETENIVTQSQPTKSSIKAEKFLSAMTSYLNNTKSFSFEADITWDDKGKQNQKIQRGALGKFNVKRPNQIRIDYDGDRRDVSFYYDGNEFVILESVKNVYGVIPLTSDLDGLVDTIEEDYGFAIPMGSLIATNLYSKIMAQAITSDYVGLAKIRGVSCHHLVFTGETVDLQLWIADGDKPLPCKFIITYKQEASFPQYTAILSNWDFTDYPSNDSRFQVQLPPNVNQVEILPNRLEREKP